MNSTRVGMVSHHNLWPRVARGSDGKPYSHSCCSWKVTYKYNSILSKNNTYIYILRKKKNILNEWYVVKVRSKAFRQFKMQLIDRA